MRPIVPPPLGWSGKLRRYVLTAGAAAVVDLGGFAILSDRGMGVVASATLSFLVANVVNYLLSARYAFGRTPTLRRYPLFLASAGAGLAVNVAATSVAALQFDLAVLTSKIVGIGLAFAVNFALNAGLVFVRD